VSLITRESLSDTDPCCVLDDDVERDSRVSSVSRDDISPGDVSMGGEER
jgi:hypothetical protein